MENSFLITGILRVKAGKNEGKVFANLDFMGGRLNLRGEIPLEHDGRQATVEGYVSQDKWGIQFNVRDIKF